MSQSNGDILSAVTEMGQDELSAEIVAPFFWPPRRADGHSQNELNSAGFRGRFAALGEHPTTLPVSNANDAKSCGTNEADFRYRTADSYNRPKPDAGLRVYRRWRRGNLVRLPPCAPSEARYTEWHALRVRHSPLVASTNLQRKQNRVCVPRLSNTETCHAPSLRFREDVFSLLGFQAAPRDYRANPKAVVVLPAF